MGDAREFLIERQVSKLLYESIDGWDKWLKRAGGGLSMTDLPVDWPVVREGFARRNLIVHADGIVNHLYLGSLKGVQGPLKGGHQVGDKLNVDEEYLSGFLQEISALGRMLAVSVGLKLRKNDRLSFFRSLNSDTYRSLTSGHWRTTITLSQYAMTCDLPRAFRVEAQTRGWVARRELFGVDSIKSEVESWDVSGLAEELAHRKSVLLGSADSIDRVRNVIKSEKLTPFDVAVDPLYAHIRSEFLGISSPTDESLGRGSPELS